MALPADVNALRTAITLDQGLDSLDEIKLLSDLEVADLCKALRCPGGGRF
jgi:hypothetical protein